MPEPDSARPGCTCPARSALVAYVTYLEATGRVEREALWLQTARTAQDLDALLKISDSSSDRSSLTPERLQQRNGELADRTQKLEFQLKELLGPFQPEALIRSRGRASRTGPSPSWRAGEVEAILTTPFPTAPERTPNSGAQAWRSISGVGELPAPRLGRVDRSARPTATGRRRPRSGRSSNWNECWR